LSTRLVFSNRVLEFSNRVLESSSRIVVHIWRLLRGYTRRLLPTGEHPHRLRLSTTPEDWTYSNPATALQAAIDRPITTSWSQTPSHTRLGANYLAQTWWDIFGGHWSKIGWSAGEARCTVNAHKFS